VLAGALAADPVVPPDPLEVRDLHEDQGDDREEEKLAAHPQNVAAKPPQRVGPFGLNRLAAQEDRPAAGGELGNRPKEGCENESRECHSQEESWTHAL
jgi:hypothetical protein